VIVRTLAGPPSPTIQKSGSNLQVSWSIGTLLQATNLTGPWTTNTAMSPLTISPVSPRCSSAPRFRKESWLNVDDDINYIKRQGVSDTATPCLNLVVKTKNKNVTLGLGQAA